MSSSDSEREAAYDDLRRRIRHRHTLSEIAVKKRRRRRWFLAYSLLVLSTLAGIFWSTSSISSLREAIIEVIANVYPREAQAAKTDFIGSAGSSDSPATQH